MAWAYVVDRDQSGIYVKTWNPGSIPMLIKLPVGSSPTFSDGTKYTTIVQAAMQVWNAQLGVVQFTSQIIDTPINPPTGTYATTGGDTLNEIVMDSSYAGMSFGEGTLAVTTTYTRGNTRVQSDLVFNSDPIVRDSNTGIIYHLSWDSYRGSSLGHGTVVDIRRVAIHELGHTLGLQHSNLQAKDAIMYFQIEDTSPDTLQADDIAGAQLLYASPGFVPANNDFANATTVTLTGSSIQLSGTNVAATKQSGEPAHAGANSPNGHSVWWRWTAPGSGSTTITTLGSNFDTVLAVYTGASVSALTSVASNDDAQNDADGHVRTSTVTFNAVGGTTYSIAVDGWGSTAQGDQNTYSGAITLNLTYAGSVGTAPTFTTQPSSQTVTVGATVNFNAAASGTPAPTYQWQKGGVNIAGATGNAYSIPAAVLGDAGNYSVVATNSAGSVTSNVATLTVNPANVAPAITTQPVSQGVTEGNAATFTVAASGNPTPTYQWQRLPSGGGVWSNLGNGGSYSNVTTATLSVGSATIAMSGDQFRCVATNSVNSATSNSAMLTVTAAAPVITTQPTSRTVTAGSSVNFTVAATSSVALTYQWRKDAVAIAGATNASYAIANVQNVAVGSYTVVVTNSGGSTTSAVATLSLSTIPAGFDVNAYLARYPAVAAVFGNDPYGAWIYYHDQGIYNGEVFDELFRVEEYLALYPELFALFGNDLGGALVHWLTIGRLEGRLGRIPLEFSATGYFTRNPDVATAVNNDPLLAWSHYWLYGIYEGRAYDDELRVFEYLAINADLTAAFVNDWREAALHWMRYGRTEGRLGRLPLTFSVATYLSRNPDVAAVWGTDPTTVFLHFWLYGIDEGRTYDDLFRANDYLALNPDLAVIFGTDRRGAFKHWVRYGQAEGRQGRN